MKKLYCFDFDGTLTYRDTMFLYLSFYNKRRFRFQFVRFIPLFILLKFKLVKAENVKRSFVASVLKGASCEEIRSTSQRFFDHYFPTLFRRTALDFIASIDREKTDCVIVSASLDIWVQPFADHFRMQLLATRAAFKEGIFDGGFVGHNCNGEEKVRRLQEIFTVSEYDKIIAFGDTAGDHAMMNWADEGHFKFFH